MCVCECYVTDIIKGQKLDTQSFALGVDRILVTYGCHIACVYPRMCARVRASVRARTYTHRQHAGHWTMPHNEDLYVITICRYLTGICPNKHTITTGNYTNLDTPICTISRHINRHKPLLPFQVLDPGTPMAAACAVGVVARCRSSLSPAPRGWSSR